eukprot:TRINITY_DN25358_c0_g1_i1.p1 TRINITY_DN25358_c0_g1~~TRINITY_DN25358_c0_g1_i1.p1  ORF type:complete len:318 (+),score=114.42 TRINITY_DN25358_c0_g1_i1:87-956(+)
MVQQRLGISGVKHVVAISSCKGGVGKSTTAVNLSLAFKNLGKRTGVLDLDVQGPSIPRMLNLHKLMGLESTVDGKILPAQNYGIKAMSLGMLVADDKSVVARGPIIGQQVNQLLRTVDWGDLDILCLDMPPGTHDVHLTTAQQLTIDGAVIVTTPQEIAAMDTRRGMDMFRELRVPIFGMVENMSHFICPTCTDKHFLFGEKSGAEEAARQFQIPFLGSLPFALQNRAGCDDGEPVAHLGEEGNPIAKPYYDIARKIIAALEDAEHNPVNIVFERDDDEDDTPAQASSA